MSTATPAQPRWRFRSLLWIAAKSDDLRCVAKRAPGLILPSLEVAAGLRGLSLTADSSQSELLGVLRQAIETMSNEATHANATFERLGMEPVPVPDASVILSPLSNSIQHLRTESFERYDEDLSTKTLVMLRAEVCRSLDLPPDEIDEMLIVDVVDALRAHSKDAAKQSRNADVIEQADSVAVKTILPAWQAAQVAYEFAFAEMSRRSVDNSTDKRVYAWLNENGSDNQEYELPIRNTWTTYLRRYRNATGTSKHKPRKPPQPTRSSVPARDLDRAEDSGD